jgi:hypothetical protein
MEESESSSDGIPARWLHGANPFMRAASLWVICALLFVISWELSFYLLPEGVLRGKLLASRLPIQTPRLFTTFLRIYSINLIVGCGLVTVANFSQLRRLPMGYIVVMIHSVLYAILLGTNSFGIPGPGRFAPSLDTALGRSGIFEISAYVLVAAATRNLVIWRQQAFLTLKAEQVGSPRAWHLERGEGLLIIVALVVLAGANLREAHQLMQAIGT